jgi:pyoverdine/dityrosine biosynthesis protein Dit1
VRKESRIVANNEFLIKLEECINDIRAYEKKQATSEENYYFNKGLECALKQVREFIDEYK